MSEVKHSPYQHTSNQIASEVMDRIKTLDDGVMFYTRMMQIIEGGIFEGIQFGLNAVESFDAQGPAELFSAYNAGIAEGRKEIEE